MLLMMQTMICMINKQTKELVENRGLRGSGVSLMMPLRVSGVNQSPTKAVHLDPKSALDPSKLPKMASKL